MFYTLDLDINQWIFLFKKLLQNPTEIIRFYIDHRCERESQIIEVLKSHPDDWYTEMDIVKIIYAETPMQLWKAAAKNIFQHLCKLERECKIQSKQNHNGDDMFWKCSS